MTHQLERTDRSWIESTTRAVINSAKADWFAEVGVDLIAGRREGCHVWDIDGRRYLDALCDGSTYTFGHRHPALVEALVEGVSTYDIGCQFLTSRPRAEFADALVRCAPDGLDHVHLVPSGSEAVDTAIKAARHATQRSVIVVVEGAFHGVTGLAAGASGGHYAEPFGVDTTANWRRVPWNDPHAMEAALAGCDVAAVLLEPVPATSGWPIPSETYLADVRKHCDNHGTLLIADEVQTGYGRLGTLWGVDRFGVSTDLLVMAKGAGGGLYPIGYVLMNDRAAAWIDQEPFAMPSTFGGSELGCVVANRALQLAKEPDHLTNIRARSSQLSIGLAQLQDRFGDEIAEVRHLGLAVGIKMRYPDGGLQMMSALFRNGVLAIYAPNDASVVQLKPPLVINDSEIEELLEAVGAALSEVANTSDHVGDRST